MTLRAKTKPTDWRALIPTLLDNLVAAAMRYERHYDASDWEARRQEMLDAWEIVLGSILAAHRGRSAAPTDETMANDGYPEWLPRCVKCGVPRVLHPDDVCSKCVVPSPTGGTGGDTP